MKLLTRYNRANIFATITVLLLSSICYYYILQSILLSQLDDDLKVEQQEIIDYAAKNKKLPNAADYKDLKIAFEPAPQPLKTAITSLDIFNPLEHEAVSTRILVFSLNLDGKNYKAFVSKSQEGTEDLIKLIVLITLAMVLLLLAVLFSVNRFVLNKLWHPFNDTLKELQQFNVSSIIPLQLHDNNITEFMHLNKAVTTMSNRVISDYTALKSFTENASHEIQTPLAIINSKIELLIQGENFTEPQMRDILTIHDEASRLSKLNKSLLLLTKIDNEQFQQSGLVGIQQIIRHYLDKYEELITAKKITLTKKIGDNAEVAMNEAMAQVLISNLINNAIKHNIENGSIDVVLDAHQLVITNTGLPPDIDTSQLFERFKKAKVDSESLGLGLAIVKKICGQYHLGITYTYGEKMHRLAIQF